jgi:hypothetical protein
MRDVLTTRNPSDEHGVTGTLRGPSSNDLVASDGARRPPLTLVDARIKIRLD